MVERFQEEVSQSCEPSDQGWLTTIDLIHEFPYRNLGIEVARDLEFVASRTLGDRNPKTSKGSMP
jgi:hypothetical protein